MKLNTRWIACLVAGLGGLLGLSAQATDLTGSYTWKPLKVGGGGWVVGMDYSSNGFIYCRADVSGAYRWNGPWGTSTWTQMVTTSSMPAGYKNTGTYQGVDSIVGSPNNAASAYMAYQGQIFRSWNYGASWSATTFGSLGVAMGPNGASRRCGERLGVDPATDNNAYYCPMNDQPYRQSAFGGAWTKITAIPLGTANWGITTVKFDPTSGTNGSGFTNVVYITVMNGGVWRSANGGTTWTNIATLTGGPGNATGANHSVVGPDGTYYVCCGRDASATSGIWKYVPSTGTWTNISPSTNTTDYQAIAVDPFNANRITVQKQGGQCWTSTTQGASWTSQTWDRATFNINWLSAQTDHWMSVGAMAYDPTAAGSGKLWFAEGFGMWNTTDLADTNITWTERSAGIEETCGNDVICPPGGSPISAMWDISAFKHTNPDTYTATRRRSVFISGWALDWCPATPSFVAGVFHDHTNGHPPLDATGYSNDGGSTWTTFPAVTSGQVDSLVNGGLVQYGVIAVSATNSAHIVWSPASHILPYYTSNTGTSFTQSAWPAGVTSSGIPTYPTAMKPLCADRVTGDKFYLYIPTDGIYASTNGGANWSRVGNNPANVCYNSTLKAVPGIANDLWFSSGFGAGGLYHSTNGGTSWTLTSSVTKAYCVGFGKTAVGATYPTIFIYGIVGGVEGIYRSTNSGSSWDQVCAAPLGIYDTIDAMDGDKDTFGKVYVCFSYSGFAYGVTSGP